MAGAVRPVRRWWWGGALTLAVSGGLLCLGCGSGNPNNFIWGRNPVFAPDGTRLYFAQNLSTPSDQVTTFVSGFDAGAIWRIDVDGQNPTRLTPDGRGPDFFPSVSPDGTLLAFISGEHGQYDVWVMNSDGTGRRQLTFDVAADTTPRWNPDGLSIVFVSERSGNADLWRIQLDGSGLEQLTSFPSDEATPSYTRDGATLLFASNRDRSNFDIWAMDAGGGNLRQLTRKDAAGSKSADGGPNASPDGSTVLFERWEGHWQIWRVNIDSTGLARLTTGEQHNGDPEFSPDGRSVAFTSSRSGWWQVWLMDPDGTAPRIVTGD
ncbi:MAG: PD40 domain-containing protein [Armatimonadetes bacterium]|nr:PD40 domain-containing protein [Armatimonadota bacterium]